ncbi:hypothetical protein OHB12_00850 [Nocardia sp. NBC_01730]|uniref:hypothetical protein n=1 Tax=Nocardia sp. NBC_01730 TaxID=2975998 RepID=UPI002E0FA724|nr:hypothetical protein OHB12_00850 [Nocardia sp. NBC_01730]
MRSFPSYSRDAGIVARCADHMASDRRLFGIDHGHATGPRRHAPAALPDAPGRTPGLAKPSRPTVHHAIIGVITDGFGEDGLRRMISTPVRAMRVERRS